MIDCSSLLAAMLAAAEQDPALVARLRRLLGAPAAADDLLDARAAGLSAREFRAAVRRGELEASRVGRRYVCTRAALTYYLERKRVAATPDAAGAVTEPSSPAERAIARARATGSLRLVGGGRR
jgi:hypothetical protein